MLDRVLNRLNQKQVRPYIVLAIVILVAALLASFLAGSYEEYTARFVGGIVGGVAFFWGYRFFHFGG